MTGLDVNITAGPLAGKRLVLRHSPVTFGRAADNQIVLDLPAASRYHGELQWVPATGAESHAAAEEAANGQWVLVNHSANGTELNGKRVTKKPRPLDPAAAGDIAIGGQTMFRVAVRCRQQGRTTRQGGDAARETGAAAGGVPAGAGGTRGAEQEAEDVEDSGGKKPLSGRAKIWLGIGVFWLIIFGAAVFLSTLSSGGGGGNAPAPELTRVQIREAVRKPIPKHAPDVRRASANLEEANEFFARRGGDPAALYRAHEAYQLALSYRRGTTFHDPVNERRRLVAQQQLVKEVRRQYQQAYTMLRSRQYKTAANAFRKLLAFYPDPRSVIYQNAQKQLAVAQQALSQR